MMRAATILGSLAILGLVAACGSSTATTAGTGGSMTSGTGGAATSTSSATSSSSASGGGAGGGSPCSGPRPGPSNTGVPAGTKLTPSDSITVMEDGAVIEGLDIQGTITVLANDVTIRKVRVVSGDYYPIRYFDNDNTGLVVEDSEIEGTSDDVTSAIAFANYTARRLNIHGGADGFKADSNVLIEDCWIHDLRNGPDQHNDGVQSTGGKGVTLRHNDISGASNACVQTGDSGGVSTEDLTIECNWLSGGGYSLNIRGTGETVPKDTKIIDNRFGRDSAYGPWTLDDPNPTVTGNVYDDNDEPIPYP
ncbi:Hypothetical protein A7982_06837 [Minicystis rosea]|nr:Hypothetical protein A7982_06837 [Minicystis rosea]